MIIDQQSGDLIEPLEETKARLLGSFLHFTQVFYELRTGRPFKLSQPPGRESHYITIARALTDVFNGKSNQTIINIPPRYGKTELLIHFVAWCLARYPDSNFLYVSYSHTLASKQTATIRDIITMPYYRKIFGVRLSESSSAKDCFETTAGGSVYAAGTAGTITGRGAGVKGVDDRFSGAFILDDAHKPDEASSDVMRENVIDWFYNTASSRFNNGNKTPLIYIGQRVHEEDLAAELLAHHNATRIVAPALDVNNNPLDPSLHDLQALKDMETKSPYVFAAQYQQDPQPAGGGIFKPEWFYLTEMIPKDIICTFITADTAETDKTYNDPSVFSFWGLYKIKHGETQTDEYAIHWIDCWQEWLEPKDLQDQFMAFYAECMRFPVKPMTACIEKKSTGSTLVSILSKYQGLRIMPIERTKASGSKVSRFLEIQPYVASNRVSLTVGAKHTNMCIEHCRKITANGSYAHDDIADTLYDAIKVSLIDKIIGGMYISKDSSNYNRIAADVTNISINANKKRRQSIWAM